MRPSSVKRCDLCKRWKSWLFWEVAQQVDFDVCTRAERKVNSEGFHWKDSHCSGLSPCCLCFCSVLSAHLLSAGWLSKLNSTNHGLKKLKTKKTSLIVKRKLTVARHLNQLFRNEQARQELTATVTSHKPMITDMFKN